MVGDQVGDFIVQLANASAARREAISVPYSKLKLAIAQKLTERGFVKSAAKRGKKVRKYVDVELLYHDGSPKISGVKRISKPGRRVYQAVSEIRPVRYGKGTMILSTPRGILSGEEARKAGVGGEALFSIW